MAILFNLFNGRQDVGNSTTEIHLRKWIKRSPVNKAIKEVSLKEADENSDKWHRDGLITYILFCVIGSIGVFQDSWFFALMLTLVLGLFRVIIFNPIVAKGVAPDLPFYRLGNDAWDAFWKRITGEKVYYFGSLFLAIILLVLIFNRGLQWISF